MGYDSTVVLYEVVGATASSFAAHQSHYDGGNVGGGSQYTTYTSVSLLELPGIAFAQMSVAFNTVCGEDRNNPPTFLNNNMIPPANALCDSYSYGGEILIGPMPLDENNGWAHYTFSTNANQTWTWSFAANALISEYASTLDFFQGGAHDVSAPTGLNTVVH